MRFSFLTALSLSIFLLLNTVAFSFETDQYNLPPVPLADIGDEVSEYVENNLLIAVNTVNQKIGKSVSCLETADTKPKGCGSAETERTKLLYLRTDKAVAHELF